MTAIVGLRVVRAAVGADPEPQGDLPGIVRERADALLDSLGIPVRIELEDGGSHPGTAGDPPYLFDVDGEPARLDRSSSADGMEGLRFRLEADLRRNAHLFLTPPVTETLRNQWSDRTPRPPVADLPPDRLLELIRECVRAGCRVDRLAEVEPGGDERDPLEWRLLEGALEAAARLRVEVPHGALPEEGPDALSRSLEDSVHTSWGVLLPTPHIVEPGPSGPGITDVLHVEALDLSLDVPLSPPHQASAAILAALQPRLPWFLTRETLTHALSRAEEAFPRLTAAVRERHGDAFLARTFRALVAEGVPVGDLRTLLAGLLEIREPTSLEEPGSIVFHAPAGTPPLRGSLPEGRLDPEGAADCIRRWAQWQIAATHGEGGTLRVRLLDPGLEDDVRMDGVRPGSALHRRFLDALHGSSVPILTNVDVRRRVRRSLELERPDVPVLSFQELHPESRITPVERVSL